MPKGRLNAPSTASVGNWYQHRGLPQVFYNTPPRVPGTTTGAMLETPYVEQSYPFPPPQPYIEKDSMFPIPPSSFLPSPPPSSPTESVAYRPALSSAQSSKSSSSTKSFKSSNSFSVHNNRNALQDCGEYFGDGRDTRYLGKMNQDPYHRQHFTGSEYLSHEGEQGQFHKFHTMYRTSYFGDQSTSRPTMRRFPKKHHEGTEGPKKLDTTTTDWFKEPDVPYKTKLQVLASSQEPHLRHNKWKYSNHGLPRIYPPYNVTHKEPAVKIF